MICAYCSGPVFWCGPFSNLTHTECADCGRINCQEVEQEVEQDTEEREEE